MNSPRFSPDANFESAFFCIANIDCRVELYRLAIESPEGAIVLAYIDLERELRDIASKIGMGSKVTNQRSVMEDLVNRNLLTRDASRLFDSLRRARNSAAHGVGEEKVTSQDAVEYIRQVNLLLGLLHAASAQLSDP